MRTKLAGLIALLLVVAACSSDGTADSSTTSAADATTTTAAATTTTTAAITTTDGPTTTSGSQGGGEGGEACLVGTWEASEQSLQERFETLMADSGLEIAEVTGSITLEIRADGTSDYTFNEVTLTSEVEGNQFRVQITGASSADWTATGDTITTTSTSSDLEITTFIQIGDEVIEGEVPIDADFEPEEGSATYTCSEDLLTVETTEGTESPIQEYTRAG